jgi:hypothetical protein
VLKRYTGALQWELSLPDVSGSERTFILSRQGWQQITPA